jgi:small subunit ribosomal protein S6
VVRTDVWGKRRLAYEVNRLREGYYVLTDFQIEQPRITEMENTLRISDTVFRHVIVRKPAQAAAAQPAAPPTDGEAVQVREEPAATVAASAEAEAESEEEAEEAEV